jgi:hypothetical protein
MWAVGVFGATHEGVQLWGNGPLWAKTNVGEDFAVEIDTTTETSYADLSGAAGKTYYYAVTAVGASTESGFSAFVAGKR